MKKNTRGIFATWKRMHSWQKILLGLASGVLTGVVLGPNAIYLKPIGTIFINGINMMVTPVVFTSIVCAIISINDPKRMRRLGLKTISLYVISMAVAAVIGLAIATLIGPGKNFHPNLGAEVANTQHIPSLVETLINIVPANPVNAFAHGHVIQILVFALLLGIAINMTGEAAEPVSKFFRSFSLVVFKLTSLVMSFAPLGIFALMAWVAGEFGLDVLVPLLKLILTVYVGCLLQSLLFFAPVLAFVSKLNPWQFFRNIVNPLLMSFTSSSSAATLPTTLKTAEEKVGIPASIGQFLLPLGMSLNMNGMAVFLGIATVFTANLYGTSLGLTQYLTVILSIILTGMGSGGMPGTGIIAISAVLSSVGLPLGAIPLLAGVDRINDMVQTATNVTADMFVATVIAKHEKELDLAIYNGGAHSEVVHVVKVRELGEVRRPIREMSEV